MGVILEIVGQVILELALSVPGGFLCWVTTGRQGKLSDYIADNQTRSLAIGLVIWIVVTFAVYLALGT